MMKRMLALFLSLLCWLPAARAEGIAPLLQFTQQQTEREYVRDQVYVQAVYPATANEQVNREMRALIDEMTAAGREYLPSGKISLMPAYLDVGANIFRAGQKWMSFLTIARVAYEREQTYVAMDARCYDMETGARLSLSDLFASDSPAWEQLAGAVREQLSAYFDGLAPDAEALDALCSREGLMSAGFTLSPARLTLHYPAALLYPGKQTLMHVKLYYSAIREYMTEAARENIDCRAYKLIALTYDDGGARGSSMNVMEQLRLYGASATFFLVGQNNVKNHDVICREHDAGHAVESHNYEHVYEGHTTEKVAAWRQKMDRDLNAIIGTRATYMRAPGGKYQRFINSKAGLPLIQWSVISGDAGSNKVSSIAGTVIKNAEDGAVVLMHDLNSHAWEYTAIILPELEKQGYLCVTVDELFDYYGVELLPDTVYYSCEEEAKSK